MMPWWLGKTLQHKANATAQGAAKEQQIAPVMTPTVLYFCNKITEP
jgi:hypothetical protein